MMVGTPNDGDWKHSVSMRIVSYRNIHAKAIVSLHSILVKITGIQSLGALG